MELYSRSYLRRISKKIRVCTNVGQNHQVQWPKHGLLIKDTQNNSLKMIGYGGNTGIQTEVGYFTTQFWICRLYPKKNWIKFKSTYANYTELDIMLEFEEYPDTSNRKTPATWVSAVFENWMQSCKMINELMTGNLIVFFVKKCWKSS